MDRPQVEVGGPEPPRAPQAAENTQAPPNNEAPEVVMDPTQNTDVANEGQPESTQDPQPDTEMEEPKSLEEPAVMKKKPVLQFLDFLTSPIVELVLGPSEDQTVLTAHQSLLLESPLLAEAVAGFKDSSARRIELPGENVEAFGYFLQFQYTRDYAAAPTGSSTEEAVVGEIDDSGDQLLKHARVYTLAEKLGIPSLKTLAHSKIHRINSTSQGEIAYARYVYTHTPIDDVTIRKPVASFWAMRSHVLRHEAEQEFKKLCLDVPQFCFDVLSLVLDQKEKRSQDRAEAESGVKGSGRKRLRSGI